MKISGTVALPSMWYRSGSFVMPSGAVTPPGVVSHTSNRPSPSVSCTVVLNTIEANDRQSTELAPLGGDCSVVVTEPVSLDTYELTSSVTLSHAEPRAP